MQLTRKKVMNENRNVGIVRTVAVSVNLIAMTSLVGVVKSDLLVAFNSHRITYGSRLLQKVRSLSCRTS